ncbi:MAG TPA: hypothetical protein VGQ49_24395 [Bryobacteraceae bacterium]|jgi:hypothetical protein|nr:hypothetical protein [Bryobacteraceae bacterium]
MDLAGKYDKTNLLGDGEVQVWRGREKARGTPVLLHTFTGSPQVLRLAVEYLLTRPATSPLLDIGDIDGSTCLVTMSELDFLDIAAWLQNAVASGPIASSPIPSSPIAAAPVQQTGEQRTAPRADTVTPAPVPRADSGPLSMPAAPSNPAPQGPGEFTRAFQLPGSNVPPQQLPDPLAGSGPAKSPAGPGEFTRLFQLPGKAGNQETAKAPDLGRPPSLPPTMPLSPPPAAPAGEFTRLFKAQPPNVQPGVSGGTPLQTFRSGELPPEPAAPKLNIASGPVGLPEQRSAPPAPKGPGEYTRVMQAPALQTTAPQPSVSPSPATAQAVQLPVAGVSLPAPPGPPTLPTPSLPSVPSPSIPSAPASVPVSAPRSGVSSAVLLLGGLILVAVILVLVFALRK